MDLFRNEGVITKRFFFDLETTGINPAKHGIHQISGLVEIDGDIKERFNFNVRPNEKAIIEDEALAVGGVTREQILAYPSMEKVYSKLIELLSRYIDKYNKKDKFHIVGYNCSSFDIPFFRGFFKQNKDEYFGSWFWSASLDVMILSAHKLEKERSQMIDFKQATVARTLGIKIDDSKLHDAEYDIDICYEIFNSI